MKRPAKPCKRTPKAELLIVDASQLVPQSSVESPALLKVVPAQSATTPSPAKAISVLVNVIPPFVVRAMVNDPDSALESWPTLASTSMPCIAAPAGSEKPKFVNTMLAGSIEVVAHTLSGAPVALALLETFDDVATDPA
jgi:hypothetical protein